MRTIRDLGDLHGRRVLVRVDFNVPLADGRVTDDTRIRAALPTLKALREHGATLVLVSHLGRPKGVDPQLSLAPVGQRLSELLGVDVELAPPGVGPDVARLAAGLHPGDVLLLENIRFEPGETSNDPELARALADLADVYVDDAFGSAHRAHASTEGAPRLMHDRAAGLLLEREVKTLTDLLENPSRPLLAVLGGAKVSDKIGVIESFLHRADTILIGGAMCFPFLAAQGHTVGDSLCAAEDVELARNAIAESRGARASLALPSDLVLADRFAADATPVPLDGIDVSDGMMGLDIGSRTTDAYEQIILTAGTVFWNGPMGAFELPAFSAGTRGVAHAVASAPGVTVVGGGDSVAALVQFGFADKVTHLSTGGGASLELIEGHKLPGVEVLSVSPDRVPLVVGNWKMHKTVEEAEQFIAALLPRVSSVERTEVAICPTFTALGAMVDSTRGSRVAVCAQNMHQSPDGAFTGEVSAPMLSELGVNGVLLGHSERRELFNETDKALALKVPAALEAGLLPVLCVGETEEERERGDTQRKLRYQVQEDLARLGPERLADVVIAYEPIWAIGTGQVATPEQAQEAIAFVRALVGDRSPEQAQRTRILYGGSVKPEHARELLALPDVDGALVGGASLDAESFAAIVAAAE